MTISEDIGKFKARIGISTLFGIRDREVELEVIWVSCGVYSIRYNRPKDATDPNIIVEEDWYPPDVHISFTPEQFEKVVELYPLALKHKRNEVYKPFYEDYTLDNGMMDFENDTLFQVFKDPHDNIEKIYLVNHYFSRGSPTTQTDVLGLYSEDFEKLKDLIASKKDVIFYSGCKFSMPFVNLENIKKEQS